MQPPLRLGEWTHDRFWPGAFELDSYITGAEHPEQLPGLPTGITTMCHRNWISGELAASLVDLVCERGDKLLAARPLAAV